MNNIEMITRAAIKINLRMRTVFVVCVGVVFICVVGVVLLFMTQFIRPAVEAAVPDRRLIENYLSLILFVTNIISIGVYASVFSFNSLTREKARGNIQALLATPLAAREIWLGKSLAAYLPGLVFAELLTLAAFLAVNLVYLTPEMGMVFTPWMIISNFIAVPLVYLTLTLLVHIVGLTGKPATANVIAQIFLPVIISAMINLAVRNVPNAGSWIFTVILMGVAAIFGLIVLQTRSRVVVEKILLSG